MMSKSLVLQYLTTLTITLLAVGTSCKKSDAPLTTIEGMQPYLPQVIYQFNLPADSIVYNDDNTVAKMYLLDFDSKSYYGNYEFSYDKAKRCTSALFVAKGKVLQEDTLHYSNDNIQIVRTSYNNDEPKYTTTLLLNSAGQVILAGTKDTVPSMVSPAKKYLIYREYNYDGSNWTKCTYTDEYYFTQTSGIYIYKNNMKCNFTYDNKDNSFRLFFSLNPIMNYYFYERMNPFISCGKNNIATVVAEREYQSGNQSGKEAFSLTMTYKSNATTHVLEEVQLTRANGAIDTNRFKFIKAK
ncbi:MAG: hypothetical protein JO154_10290 [Chitinophaga sp.]|uniref:hypothetical protein n=1 Tax=Chitinophaga sp. TaxID=1869181 RepID=UPI0025B96547|nr:hypothetical protein [Chitinophaga sp.]MBV8252983.1 hypothetical protein [Chitinophaga sp.]